MDEQQSLIDENLAFRTQQGDVKAFEILVEKYEPKIKKYLERFLSKTEAQDIAQDVFLKCFVNIRSFRVELKFSSWIYRIAHNELVNFFKKKKTLPLFDFDVLLPHYHVSQKEMENQADKKAEIEQFKQCLEKLSLKYKETVILYYFEGLSYQEISDITHSPVSTVGIRIKRAKEKLKELCEQSNQNIWKN